VNRLSITRSDDAGKALTLAALELRLATSNGVISRGKAPSGAVRHVANATAALRATMHDPHTSNELEMFSSSRMEDRTMHRTIVDTHFPYVLVCSTFGAIVSLASVWLVSALAYAPIVVA
jgi:hypothetical protein